MLYFRMLLTMAVSLYTVRVVLDTLGAVDYGIFNVVGGIVTMFSFLSNSMAVASQRFFAFELGTGNNDRLKKIFSMTMSIYILMSVVIFILAETLGTWFLIHKMIIPPERMQAAHWVFQFSILSFLMTMFAIPYNAAIIAHERMNIYAWGSIIEVVLKLLIVYLLVVFSFDKLQLYAILIFSVTSIVTLVYRNYCKRKFRECRFSFYWETSLFKEITSYSGWNLFGALASVFNNQGANIILNIFFGPIVNTAKAISYQISNAINMFVQNFMTAARPQIIKYYAEHEKEKMLTLVFQSSKFSFLLLFILTMPVLLETDFILDIWLKEIPRYVVLFTRLVILIALIDALSHPLMAAAQATGKIQKYTLVVGGTMLLNLPTSYLFLRIDYPPQTIFFLGIINSLICLILRLILLKGMIRFPIMNYVRKVIAPLIVTTIIAYCVPVLLRFHSDYTGICRFLLIGLAGLVSSLVASFVFAFSKSERHFIIQALNKKQDKLKKYENYK